MSAAKIGPIQPDSWTEPRGYSNGMLMPPGQTLFVAGQIGWDAQCNLVSTSFVPQFRQALDNVLQVVHAAGGESQHIGRLTIYVTDKQAYNEALREIGSIYRDLMGKHYPAMALVQVADLLEPNAMVEIEATAIIPQ